MLHVPYQPFRHLITLLQEASIDPLVQRISVTQYRLASKSCVAGALQSAARNGKEVFVLVEPQARFDEQANIKWASQYRDAGVNVQLGVQGLKVHSKLLLIERREEKGIRYYSHLGTGNFNEKTARLYTDFTLLTRDQNIGKDVASIFEFLKYPYRRPNYKLLLVSPHSSRSGLIELIDQEIANARDGYHAEMVLKCNNLVDRQLTMKLYEASDAGVDVKLIVRGMCSLKPGVKGISDNISAVSIVDRYLEHPRAFVFHNKGNPRYFIGSADLMTRNLDYRVEALCPIFDEDAQDVMQAILDQQWHDNVKARVLNAEQDNVRVSVRKKVVRIRSQETIHRYLKTGKLPRYPKTTMRDGPKRRRKKNL